MSSPIPVDTSSFAMLAILWLLSIPILPILAGPDEDNARLGSYYTNIAIYRSGSGNNVVSVGLGDPVQDFNLTLSTNVDFILVAAEDCSNCLNDAFAYVPEDSTTNTPSRKALSATAIFPTSEGSIDVIELNGNLATERVTDPRQDSYDRVVGILSQVEEVTELGQQTRPANLPAGVSGFFGLGVNQASSFHSGWVTADRQADKGWSIMPSLKQTNGRGEPAGIAGYVVGFDMAPYSRDTNVQAGDLHFGAVPRDAFTGNFDWREANTSVAGGWGLSIDRLRVAGKVIDGGQYYATLDPGFDSIYVPPRVAQDLFSAVDGAVQDVAEPTRWNVPCDAKIPMTVTLANREYNVDSSQLVQQRGPSPNSCWSSIIAWQNGSLPDTNGEIRLGTPFLSGVYAALYYSDKQQFVGIAGKPGSVNDFNALSHERKGPNGKLAGILIGSLLAALIILLLCCYARNRNSFQSVWYRGIRRQWRAQNNALVRAATIPPPLVGAIGAGMVVPPPMMHPGQMGMGMGMGMGPMGVPGYMPVPMGPGPGSGGYGHPMVGPRYGGHPGGGGAWPQAPPMYQAPMQPPPQQQQQQYSGQQPPMQNQSGQDQHNMGGMKQPMSIEHTPRGMYSARHQSLPLPVGGRHGHSKPSRYSHPNHHHPRHQQPGPSHYGPRHGDIPHGDLGEGLLAVEPEVNDRYHTAPTPGPGHQKLHFGGVGARRHQYGGGGPGPVSEGSMVQRDRAKAAEEAALEHQRQQRQDSLDPKQQQLAKLREARELESKNVRTETYGLFPPKIKPSSEEKRKSWRTILSRDKDPRYPIKSYDSETGRDAAEEERKAKLDRWRPKPSSTWIKNHYGEGDWRGFKSWKRAERDAEKRAGEMGSLDFEPAGGLGERGRAGARWYA